MRTQKKIKVLVVDDSALIREMFTQMLSEDKEIEVVGVAHDPYDARQKIKQLMPDVITLDIEMPHMDGISFLEKIMALRPMPVIMISTLTQKNAQATIHSLELGAVDYIAKPQHAINKKSLLALKDELSLKVKIAAKAHIGIKSANHTHEIVKPSAKLLTSPYIIAIGASTGGVEAIKEVLTQMPREMPPILLTQHMPEGFTKSFAERLNTVCALTVHEAKDHQLIERGNVYVASGAAHLRIATSANGYVCRVGGQEKISSHCPSVDVLFHSVAAVVGKNAIGVIMTGMGKDGADGLLHMREKGAYTLGQSEKSCVVYGMPKVAMMQGAVEKEVNLSSIASEIINKCS